VPKAVANPGVATYTTLDESTWLIPLCWAFDVLGDGLSPVQRAAIADRFLAPAGEYLMAHHRGSISNFACWNNAAIGTVGLVLGRDDLARFAISGPFGFDAQLRAGVLGDGLWFEGSFSYHFYTVAACLALAQAARHTSHDLRDRPALAAMLRAPILCAYPDGTLPATNDCWYFTSLLRDCCHGVPPSAALYELGYAWYRDPLFGQVLRSAYGDGRSRSSSRTEKGSGSGHAVCAEPERLLRDSLEALLFGADKLPAAGLNGQPSIHLPDSGYAILRSPPRGRSDAATQRYLLLKHGPHGGVHGHPDKLSVSLFAHGCRLSPDLGAPGYGLKLYESWYRQTASHNTVTLDGHSQPPTTGRMLRFDGEGELQVADAAVAWADEPANGAYAGVEFRRVLLARPDYIFDLFVVTCSEVRRIDWFFRCAGELMAPPHPGRSAPSGKEKRMVERDGQGYQHITGAQHTAIATDLALAWHGGGTRLNMWLAGTADTELITGRVPGNPASETQALVVVRRWAAATAFATVWYPYRRRTGVTAVEWISRDLVASGWVGCTVHLGRRCEAVVVRLHTDTDIVPGAALVSSECLWKYGLD
jgi:hypothetical protein